MEETPGIPLEVNTPKESTPDRPSFSLGQLEFIDVFYADPYRVMIFLVEGKYTLLINEWEYYNYTARVLDLIEAQKAKGATCFCDLCEPDYEKQTNGVNMFAVDEKGNREENGIELPTYLVSNLVETVKIGIHAEHK